MKPKDRDELLIRLDERSRNTWTTTEKIEAHLVRLNDGVAKHSIKLGILWGERKRIIGLISTGAIALILKLVGIY